jgi:hypothetical protein
MINFNSFLFLKPIKAFFFTNDFAGFAANQQEYYIDPYQAYVSIYGVPHTYIRDYMGVSLSKNDEYHYSKYSNGDFFSCFTNPMKKRIIAVFCDVHSKPASFFFSMIEDLADSYETFVYGERNELLARISGDFDGIFVYDGMVVLARQNYGEQNLPNVFTIYIYNLATGQMVAEQQYDHFIPPGEHKPLGLAGIGIFVHATDDYFIVTLREGCGIACFDWKGNLKWHHSEATLVVEKYHTNIWHAYMNALYCIDMDAGVQSAIDLLPYIGQEDLIASGGYNKLTEDGWYIFPASKFADRGTHKIHSLWAIHLETREVVKLFELDTVNKPVLVSSLDYRHGLLSISYFQFGERNADYTRLYYRTDKPLEGFGALFMEKYSTPEPWQAAGIEVSLEVTN